MVTNAIVQQAADLVTFAREILARYGEEFPDGD